MADRLIDTYMHGLRLSISKEALSKLPAEVYTDGGIIVDSIERMQQAVSELRQAPIIGFDTETRPSFRRGVSHDVSLMQLATPEKCFLFRLHLIGLPDELRELLEDESLLKVGVSLRDDFRQLRKVGLERPAGFIDLQQYVRQFSIADSSLSRIYGILFGHRIAKAQRLSNWEAETLTAAQANYAALDAIACIRIYRHLRQGCFHPEESIYKSEA